MSSAIVLSSLLASVAAPTEASPTASIEAPVETFAFHLDHVLGTSFDMTVVAPNAAQAQFAFAAATNEIARLDRVLSGWREDSELSALNRASVRKVSSELFAVLSACEAWRARTGGAFSARLGEVEAAWVEASDAAPDAQALCATAARAQAADVRLDRATRTVTRPEGVTFAVDALAKGYVIDAALAAARRAAPCAQAMLVDIGGDMACWGDKAWKVGVADPAQTADNAAPVEVVRLSNRALAVSGPGARDRVVAGEARSHLLDAATGQPAPRVQAAVLGPDAATADALATALAVMPADQGLALAEATPGIEAMLIEAGKSRFTSGWAACQAPAPLPAGFQVEVTYNLPKIEAGNYKKPYVLAWVTGADKTPIKTLMILGNRQDYQEDNYVWWRRYGRKQPGAVEAMGKPTKGPGRYTVGWDGTDQDGKRVAQGAYIIHIEAAREHGGHAYQAIELNLGAGPIVGQAPGKDELGATQARYREEAVKADVDPKAQRKAINWKAEVYRQSRTWHGYLSAFAFLTLIFFAVTGLLLNHPEWTKSDKEQPSQDGKVQLAPADLAAAKAAADPSRALAEAVSRRTPLLGAYQSGEVIDGEAMLRLEGPKGSSDVIVDMETGGAEVTVKRARLIDTLNELHRGKNASAAWKAVIDISAILVLALSVIGYILFFSLRFRLRTSLILTGVSLGALVGVVVFLTP